MHVTSYSYITTRVLGDNRLIRYHRIRSMSSADFRNTLARHCGTLPKLHETALRIFMYVQIKHARTLDDFLKQKFKY